MKTWNLWLVVAALAAGLSAAQAKLNVVATTQDLAAIAEVIGGREVSLTTLAKPTEDPHFVDARPSFILKLNRADVLIEGGAELEAGWLAPLVNQARNPKILPRAPGRIACSAGVQMLEVPAHLDRSTGDIHGDGNPHYLNDPANAGIVARRIADAFGRLDPPAEDRYQENLSRFLGELETRMQEWTRLLAPFKGRDIVAYHDLWPYFAKRFELKIDTFLEPKPGIPPTPSHLAAVISKMKAERIGVILVEPFQSRKTAEAVVANTGAKIVETTQYPGGVKGTEGGYLPMMDHLVRSIAVALQATK